MQGLGDSSRTTAIEEQIQIDQVVVPALATVCDVTPQIVVGPNLKTNDHGEYNKRMPKQADGESPVGGKGGSHGENSCLQSSKVGKYNALRHYFTMTS